MNLLDMYIQYLEEAIEYGQIDMASRYLEVLHGYDLEPYQRVLAHDLGNRIQHLIFTEYTRAQ